MTEEERQIARRTFLGVAAAGALAACAPNARVGSPEPDAPEPSDASTATAPATPSTDAAVPSTGAPTAASSSATTAATGAATAAGAAGAAAFVPNGPRTRPQVSLTFHANGDVALANRLLDVLARSGVHVTVFGVGNWMQANPALVARMLANGHEVANHTWSHPTMGPLGRSTIAEEIRRCADLLTTLTGSASPWFRPSGIEVPTPLILEEAGRAGYATSVGYDCDSLDFQDPGAAAVVANVAKTVQPGSIISVHFGHGDTLDAMPRLLDLLASRGLAPVTVGRLLA